MFKYLNINNTRILAISFFSIIAIILSGITFESVLAAGICENRTVSGCSGSLYNSQNVDFTTRANDCRAYCESLDISGCWLFTASEFCECRDGSANYNSPTMSGGSCTASYSNQPTAPSITSQPRDAIVNAGGTARFDVTANGTTPLSYQWWKGNQSISGATSSRYDTPNTTTADDGSIFKVVVSNSAGSVSSRSATLTVTESGTGPSGTPVSGGVENPIGTESFDELIAKLSLWLYIFSIPILSLLILYGAFLIVTSAGEEEKYGKGIKVIKWGVIGFILIGLSGAIAAIIRWVVS